MKNSNVIYELKTAFVVLTAMCTLNSCGNKPLSDKEFETIEHKTDSAQNVHQEYRIASGLCDLANIKIENHRDANKCLIKIYSKNYINDSIKDVAAGRFMIKVMDDDALLSAFDSVRANQGNIANGDFGTLKYICSNQKWYNDCVSYLLGKYDEEQLLQSDFFKVVYAPELQRKFIWNTKQIANIQKSTEFAFERKNIIHNELLNKYAKEVIKQR